MAAITSEVDICNLSADHLNIDSITSIASPVTKTETVFARHYDKTRRAVLRKHPWNFASKREQLASSTNTPSFGFNKAYDLPADFIRLLTINEQDVDQDIISGRDYQIENGQILINTEGNDPLRVRYVYDFTNVSKMDPMFIDMFSIELALSTSYKLTSKNTNVERLKTLANDATANAESVDGQERPPTHIQRSKFTSSRRANGLRDTTRFRFR